MVERAPIEERGGNTRYTTAAIRMASETEIAPDFEEMFARNAGYHLDPAMVAETAADYENWPGVIRTMPFSDPELVSTFAEGAPPTIAWLKEQGVPFGDIDYFGLTERSSPRISISGASVSELCVPLLYGGWCQKATSQSCCVAARSCWSQVSCALPDERSLSEESRTTKCTLP